MVGSSSYLFVLSCREGLGRVLPLVLGVSETMFVAGDPMTWPHGGGGLSGSEACAGGAALLPRRPPPRLPSRPRGPPPPPAPRFRRAVGRARVRPRLRRGLRPGGTAPCSTVRVASCSAAPVCHPHVRLVLKALGSEQPVVSGRVGFSSVTTVPGRCRCRVHTVTGPGECSALLMTHL